MSKSYASEFLEDLMAKAAARDQKEESWGISTRVARLEEGATAIRENLARQDTMLEMVMDKLDAGFASGKEVMERLEVMVAAHTSQLQSLHEDRSVRDAASVKWGKIKIGTISTVAAAAILGIAGLVLRHLNF